jgi:hypothetical protein
MPTYKISANNEKAILSISLPRKLGMMPLVGIYALPLLALLVRVAPGGSSAGSYVILAIYALFGRINAIIALVFAWLFSILNPELSGTMDSGGLSRYLLIFCAISSSLIRKRNKKNGIPSYFILITLVLLIFLVAHSILFSAIPDISVLKSVSWGLTMMALILLWQGLTGAEIATLADHVFWILVAVMTFSLPFLNSYAGFAINGSGFQGILNHPQAFGATMALLGAWSIGRLLSKPTPELKTVVIAGTCFILVFLSEARTAGLAVILGVGTTLLTIAPVSGRKFAENAPAINNKKFIFVVLAFLVIVLLSATAMTEFIVNYLLKSGRAQDGSLLELYFGSRGHLIDPMLENINGAPFRGIGFGIASHPSEMVVSRDLIIGLPTGAPIEKGVAPVAILEEIGIFGSVFVLIWLMVLLRGAALGGMVPYAVCVTALALNLGENTLFSPGGYGLLAMILFGWAYARSSCVISSHG